MLETCIRVFALFISQFVVQALSGIYDLKSEVISAADLSFVTVVVEQVRFIYHQRHGISTLKRDEDVIRRKTHLHQTEVFDTHFGGWSHWLPSGSNRQPLKRKYVCSCEGAYLSQQWGCTPSLQ